MATVSEGDRDLVRRIHAGSARGVLVADDPGRIAAELASAPAVVVVDPDDLAHAVAAARVRVAEVVVARARQADADLAAELAALPEGSGSTAWESPADADRQALRFSLGILSLALPAGVAVYVADGLWLAPALPAAALLAVGIVALVHRGADEPVAVAARVAPDGLAPSPAVRAAEAHLRRQQAAWKVGWWALERPVPDAAAWSPQLPAEPPITLVALDPGARIDEAAHATMTATAPATVRVVVLRARD